MSIRKYKPFINVGPGDIIKREMEYLGWTQEDLAEIMGLTTKSINQILNHKQAVTIDTAILLSKAIGPSPESWMNLEQNYRLRQREDSQEKKEKEQETETKAKIRKYMPLSNMKKKGWINYDRSAESQEEAFKGFWARDSLDFSMYDEEHLPLYARRSLQSDPEYTRYYTQTWLRKARMEADALTANSYDADALRNLARDIPSLTCREDGIPNIIEGLGSAGVKFFVLSHLDKTYLDGASFLSEDHPVVVYTGRYKNLDSFLWTVAHEIAHVLFHLKGADDYFLDDLKESPDKDDLEIQANNFCREVFGVEALLKATIPYRNYFTRKRLFELAEQFGMEASIILGILQFEGVVPYRTRLNNLKSSVVERLPEGVVKG